MNQSAGTPPPKLGRDLRLSLKPGLITGGLQSLYPVLNVLVMLFFPLGFLHTFIDLHNQFVSGLGAQYSNESYHAASETYFRGYYYALPTLGLIVSNFLVSRSLARQTGRIRPSILTTLLANILLLAMSIAWYTIFYLVFYDTAYEHLSYLFPYALTFTRSNILPLVVISLVSTGLLGWLGARQGMRQGTQSAIKSPPTSAEADRFAQDNQFGPLVKIYRAATPARTYLLVFGGIIGLLLWLLVQRFVLHFGGTDPAVDFIEGTIGLIALLVLTIRRRGQDIQVYQEGLVGYGDDKQLRAISWIGSTLHWQENTFQLVSKDGNRLKVSSNIEGFEELKTFVQTKVSQVTNA